jgi:lipid-A-disaccharide synthase
VVVYKTSRLTYVIAARLARVAHIGLPNLLAGKEIVPELIQDQLSAKRLVDVTMQGLSKQKRDFRAMREGLGGSGATRRLAKRLMAQFKSD